MSSADPSQTAPVDVSIRTKAPSPRRLSRKVLLAGAIGAAALVALALVSGLSTPQRHAVVEAEATPASGGPPSTIAQASSEYDAATLAQPRTDQAGDGAPTPDQNALSPPADPAWANTATAAQAARPAPRTDALADPRHLARASPIFFSAAPPAQSTQTRDSDANLDALLVGPRSPFELQAGSVIPAALITGLNSDLAGRIIAQVTAPVYDSVTGEHLLIPQGARLLGTYDNTAHYGDRRILLVWERLILPSGWSIDLERMPGSDPAGASGLSDSTDNHLGRLANAVGLSAIISILANNSQNDQQDRTSLSQSVGDAAAQQAAQTGSRIVDRELEVHPTLRVRPGASVRVLVTRDIQLRPYLEANLEPNRR